jgi:hypothetical protein
VDDEVADMKLFFRLRPGVGARAETPRPVAGFTTGWEDEAPDDTEDRCELADRFGVKYSVWGCGEARISLEPPFWLFLRICILVSSWLIRLCTSSHRLESSSYLPSEGCFGRRVESFHLRSMAPFLVARSAIDFSSIFNTFPMLGA